MTDDEDDSLDDEISELEARIERLAEAAERCRKIVFASKLAIGAGVVLLLIVILGLFSTGVVSALGSIALILGGIVSLGSNLSTLEQTMAELGEAETMRSRLIDAIDLSVVRDTPTKLM